MRRQISAVGALVVLAASSGCVSTASWVKPGATPADLERDSYECERDARQAQPPDNPFGPALRKQMFERCMKVRGWTAE